MKVKVRIILCAGFCRRGAIDMGGGADTLNLVNNVSLVSRVSSFFKSLSANALNLNLINFTGTLNTINTIDNPNGIPTVQTADGVATLDPTALGRADRTLMDFTGGVASLVQAASAARRRMFRECRS